MSKKIRYRAKYRNLTIPMVKSYTTEVGGQRISHTGEKIVFEDSIYETDDERIIKFLDEDPVCIKMKENKIFARIDSEIIEEAMKVESLEDREERIKKEMELIKNMKKKATLKEKGTKTKVGSNKEKPAY
jgi:hypothetical protein